MSLSFHDLAPVQESFAHAMRDAFNSERKAISPRFLYDQAGAELFDEITELPEYYPTRTELGILRAHADDMAALVGPDARLIEFGASSSAKVRLLLSALRRPRAYAPIAVAAEHLRQTAEEVARAFPDLAVVAVCADYTQPFTLPGEIMEGDGARVGFFPGSTIGNLEPDDAAAFLAMWARQLGPGGGMLVGVDLVKDAQVLERAYDDAAGVTARFSLNLLARANRELGADFDLAAFRHEARWEPSHSRIAIHLVSLKDQTVRLGGAAIAIAAGERIHVEYSHKYTPESFAALARRGGFEPRAMWCDPERLFSVQYLDVAR